MVQKWIKKSSTILFAINVSQPGDSLLAIFTAVINWYGGRQLQKRVTQTSTFFILQHRIIYVYNNKQFHTIGSRAVKNSAPTILRVQDTHQYQ